MGFQFRFHPLLKTVKKMLLKKEIGNVVSASFVNGEYLPNWHKYENYSSSYASKKVLGGGCILTQIHEIDYAIWLLGKPNTLFAVGDNLSKLKIDVEDSTQILLNNQKEKKITSFDFTKLSSNTFKEIF